MSRRNIHLYCGDGKGKTTAAIGHVLRALGQGKRVLLVQFLKSYPSGEIRALGTFANLQILRGKAGQGFSFSMSEEERAPNSKAAQPAFGAGHCQRPGRRL